MAILYAQTKSRKKPNKKPGWKAEAEAHAEWMAKHAPNPKLQKELKKNSTLEYKLTAPRVVALPPSKITAPVQEQVIHDPRVLYKDDPEMLERELEARERKFNSAPVYNKGGSVYITDEMMKDITAGTTRRR